MDNDTAGFGSQFVVHYSLFAQNNMTPAAQTLKAFNLRHTAGREQVLDLFLSAGGHALAHNDVETGLGPDHDRVTVYRTLRTFLDAGLLHKSTLR